MIAQFVPIGVNIYRQKRNISLVSHISQTFSFDINYIFGTIRGGCGATRTATSERRRDRKNRGTARSHWISSSAKAASVSRIVKIAVTTRGWYWSRAKTSRRGERLIWHNPAASGAFAGHWTDGGRNWRCDSSDVVTSRSVVHFLSALSSDYHHYR